MALARPSITRWPNCSPGPYVSRVTPSPSRLPARSSSNSADTSCFCANTTARRSDDVKAKICSPEDGVMRRHKSATRSGGNPPLHDCRVVTAPLGRAEQLAVGVDPLPPVVQALQVGEAHTAVHL